MASAGGADCFVVSDLAAAHWPSGVVGVVRYAGRGGAVEVGRGCCRAVLALLRAAGRRGRRARLCLTLDGAEALARRVADGAGWWSA